MFIGAYILDGKQYFNIYNKKNGGFNIWNNETFSPTCRNINVLNLVIFGKTYKEKKDFLRCLAIKWSLEFSQYSWSYGELAEIQGWFFENGKRYGLLKEFKENCIC